MSNTKQCAVLFADLRGSTALYLKLGNSEAATVVTHSLAMLGQIVARNGGRVIKTLGDGLMAVFRDPERAVESAASLQESLERSAVVPGGLPGRETAIKLKTAVAWGEIVELDNDCFGDAVNVAARILDLAGDNETLITGPLHRQLPSDLQSRFRSIDKLHLRGRKEPVAVLRMENRRFGDTVTTMHIELSGADMPDGIRLINDDADQVFTSAEMPLELGRSPQAGFCINDSRVSRTHARIESHSGHFYLSDQSYNGTHVQFDHDEQILTLRRGTCTLHGTGTIYLGTSPNDPSAARVRFEVLSFDSVGQY
ncbi:MAG: adenylate/guanylate cyclase domain-containing protein [Burkholderiales bacterium]|nr:adenylate/guanylate cyclase domain-containing protein [Burkholderiales bacterium]